MENNMIKLAEPESETITDPEKLKAYQDVDDPRELISVTIYKGGGIAKHYRGWRFYPPAKENIEREKK